MQAFVLWFLVFTSIVRAEDVPNVKENKDKEKPLPATVAVESKGSVDDLFGKIYFSQKVAYERNPKFVVGKDPIMAELNLMERFVEKLKSGAIPPAEGHLIVTRYHMADARVHELMKKAADLGAAVDFITDLNDSVEVKFAPGEKKTSDFGASNVRPDNGLNGKMLSKFLEDGFQYGRGNQFPRLGIYSQPVFNKFDADGKKVDAIFDIMHEKAIVVAHVKKGKVVWAQATSGSANMVAHAGEGSVTRVNLVREITDIELAKHRYAHALSIRENFAKGGEINDAPEEKFLRVNAKNGFVETAYTNGRNNLNDRIAALMLLATPGMTKELVAKGFDKGVESYYDRMAPEFGGWKIEVLKDLQFVNTFTMGRLAEKVLFENDPDVKKVALYDAKFSEVAGYGFTPLYVGVDLMRPMGGTLGAYSRKISDRMKTMVYLRGISGVQEDDLDGPPIARYLLHTKTRLLKGTLKNGAPVVAIFDGSLNHSNHKANAEDQDLIVIKGDVTPLSSGYANLAEALMESDAKFLHPASQALVYDAVARFTGRSPLQIIEDHAADTRTFWTELVAGNLETSKAALVKIGSKKPKLKDPIGPKAIKARIEALFSYLTWHKETFPKAYGQRDDYYLRKHLDVMAMLSTPKMKSFQKAGELVFLHWAPGVTKAQQEAWAREAWKRLGFEGDFPEAKPKDDKKEESKNVNDFEHLDGDFHVRDGEG